MSKSKTLLQRIFLSYSGLAPGWSSLSVDDPERRLGWAIICRAILDMAQFSKGRHEYHSAREFLMSRERDQYTFEWWLQHITDHPNLISKRIREGIQDDEILKELKHQHIMAMFGERHISDPRGKYLKKIAQ